jgi:transcription elongation factor GreA
MDKEIILTAEGKKKLEKKLDEYKLVRKDVAERIRNAKDFGEISENPEFENAKSEQSFIEGEIANLENLLKNAKIIEDKEIHTDIVSLGSTVRLKNTHTNEEAEYILVGTAESDANHNKISNESPIGQAIFGRKKDETINVNAPGGKYQYKIIKISRKH